MVDRTILGWRSVPCCLLLLCRAPAQLELTRLSVVVPCSILLCSALRYAGALLCVTQAARAEEERIIWGWIKEASVAKA